MTHPSHGIMSSEWFSSCADLYHVDSGKSNTFFDPLSYLASDDPTFLGLSHRLIGARFCSGPSTRSTNFCCRYGNCTTSVPYKVPVVIKWERRNVISPSFTDMSFVWCPFTSIRSSSNKFFTWEECWWITPTWPQAVNMDGDNQFSVEISSGSYCFYILEIAV